MKMLWLSLLTLMMPSKTLVMAMPLWTTDQPTQPHAEPSEAEWKVAEVFITLYLQRKLSKKVQKRACFTGFFTVLLPHYVGINAQVW